jgi:polysaccharide export outer membrane protein
VFTTSRTYRSSRSTDEHPAPAPARTSAIARALAAVTIALTGLLCGCVIARPLPPPPIKSPYTYVVGTGDVLDIEVWKEPDLQRVVVVSPDGKINFPIVGTIRVIDKTLAQIAEIVTVKIQDAVVAPSVTVTLRESRSAQVQVVGEVQKQGTLLYHERMSVLDALQSSGGVEWATAKAEAIHIVRGSLDDPILITVDLEEVLEAAARNVFLEPGDIVVVPPKYITRFDRYVTQALSPIRNITTVGQTAAYASAGIPH